MIWLKFDIITCYLIFVDRAIQSYNSVWVTFHYSTIFQRWNYRQENEITVVNPVLEIESECRIIWILFQLKLGAVFIGGYLCW